MDDNFTKIFDKWDGVLSDPKMDDNYQPFSSAGTMLPPSPEMMEDLQYEESTYAEQEVKDGVEGQDNSDVVYVPHTGPLPKYYTTDQKTGKVTAITRAEYGKLRRQQVTVVYQRVPMCGHKFAPQTTPRHRNCEACWFAFFNVHGEYTKGIEELFSKHGKDTVLKLISPKVFKNFLKFMSTVAALTSAQEARAARSQEIKDSFIPPPAQGDVNGNTIGTEPSSGKSTIEQLFEPGSIDAIHDQTGRALDGDTEGREVLNDDAEDDLPFVEYPNT